ncbi:MAG: penicillin-binding transpeptidase domain-containing protein, partial [Propionibacteriaceae bacterium]|nr:penicillin-binding transpeptidase domain-containing protein [Propionibacteriaceae bacterium]
DGSVLAMANYPSFDPNRVGDANPEDIGNRAITDPYTPGSVQKALTFSALFDAGIVKPEDVIKLPATVKSGNYQIGDAWRHGKVDVYVRGIFAKSSNVGTVLLSRKMDKNALLNYYKSFGLGQKTGIGLPGESVGILPNNDFPDYTRDGVAFGGSGVAVTAIQEAAAIAAIANGGVYNQPYLLQYRTDSEGNVEELTPQTSHRVVSEEAAEQVLSLMEAMQVNTVSDVFDIPGYRTGTKTGTTKKFDNSCRCYKGFISSVVGVAPIEDPQLLTYIVIDDPQTETSGQEAAGPVYQDIMSLALQRYAVRPSGQESPKLPIFPPK